MRRRPPPAPAALALAALALVAPALAPRPAAAQAAEDICRATEHRGRAFTICTADLDRHRIDLHLNGPDGAPLGGFEALEAAGGPVLMAMNAGMYHADRAPVGLYVEDGAEAARIVTREGPGNFGMLPNGVFCVAEDGAAVIESRTFAAAPPACRHATQSGPMLLIDGAVHPRFLPDSPSRNVRNGVGVAGRAVHFVISDEPVTFHEMATLYQGLGVRDALYFDGRVSRLHAPGRGRSDRGRRLGPMVAVRPR